MFLPLAAFQYLQIAAPASKHGTDAVVHDFPVFFFQDTNLTTQSFKIFFDFSKHISTKPVKE